MADAVVSFAIETLNEFVTQQVNNRRGVVDGVEWLKDEMSYLLISVSAAETQKELEHIRLWIDNVKDVATQAVIILERFSALQEEHAGREQGGVLDRVRSFFCICNKEAKLFSISQDIDSLKKKVVQIKNRRDEYHINDIIIATPNVKQRKRTFLRAASFEHEVDVVGFEDDVQILLDQLSNGDPSLGLISIHGMGGLGKSTLASKLYHSTELSHFQSRAWVCVSEEYDITHVLRKLINSLLEHELASLNKMKEVELLRHLRKKLLDGDAYLVVIDDIWDIEFWKKIKNAFPDKKNGSRVLITTRNRIVAEGVDDTCFVHELRFLREDESWQLFCRRAKPTLNLEKLGKEMVDKIGGLPLAIVILSGVLLQKKTYTFWSDVRNHLWRKLKGESLEIQELLNLSYDELSFQIRQCFLYLARYPEDHTIEVFELMLLWIAEGFISEANEEDGVDMEDVAENYLNELVNRNMIRIEVMSVEGQVWVCRVHDLVRDLAIQKALEHKILGIFDSSKQHPNSIRLLQGQARHVIYNGTGNYLKVLEHNSDDLNLRSLAILNKTGILKLEEMKLMYSRFKYISVLDLTSVVESEGIPEGIGNLILLKFLGLMGGGSLVIPPSIGKLKKLQTLCGSDSSEYIFPREICELKELRHIIFEQICGSLNIRSHQTKLQTLRYISYDEWFQIDTVNFTNLRTLFIKEDSNMYKFRDQEGCSLESIAMLTSLRTLLLELGSVISTIQPLSSCKNLKRLLLMGRIKDLAQLRFLPDSVTDLILYGTYFTQDPMPTLECLSNLISLHLGVRSYIGDKMVCSRGAFPCLQFLELNDLPNLKELQVDDGALPSLKGFETNCVGMDRVPERITSLPPVPNLLEYWGF